MGKPSQRPSRKDRKVTRERRERALQHGLPAAELPVPRQRSVEPTHRSETASLISAPPVARVAGNAIPTPSRFSISAVPMQLRVLVGAVVVLIAIGLYRRSTEGSSASSESVVATPDAVVQPAAQPEPPPAAEAPQTESPMAIVSGQAPEVATAPQIPVIVPKVRAVPAHKPASSGPVPVADPPDPKVPAAAAPAAATPAQKAIAPSNATPAPAENPY